MKYKIVISVCLGVLFSTFAYPSSATGREVGNAYRYPLSIRADKQYIKTELGLVLPSVVLTVDQSKDDAPIERFTALIQHKRLIDAVNTGDLETMAKIATNRNDELFELYVKMNQGKFAQTRQVIGTIIGTRIILFEKIQTKSKFSVRFFAYKFMNGEWKWEYEKNDPMINIIAGSIEHGDPEKVEILNKVVNDTNPPLITSKEGTIHWLSDDSTAGESAILLLSEAQAALDTKNYQALGELYTKESARKVSELIKSAKESEQTYRITDTLKYQQRQDTDYISIPPFILESVKTDKGRRVIRYYLKMQDGSLRFTNFFYSGFMDDFLLKYDYSSPESTLSNLLTEYLR